MSCGNQGCDCGAVGIALLLRTCWARPGLQHPNRLGGKFGQIKRHISPFNPTLWLSFTHKKTWSKPVSVDEITWLMKSPLCWLKCHALFCWGTASFMIHSFLQTDRFRQKPVKPIFSWMETMIKKNNILDCRYWMETFLHHDKPWNHSWMETMTDIQWIFGFQATVCCLHFFCLRARRTRWTQRRHWWCLQGKGMAGEWQGNGRGFKSNLPAKMVVSPAKMGVYPGITRVFCQGTSWFNQQKRPRGRIYLWLSSWGNHNEKWHWQWEMFRSTVPPTWTRQKQI